MDSYFADPPKLHSWDNGKTWNTGGLNGEMLRALHDRVVKEVGHGARICETGAGNTTITFLLTQPAELVSIAPDQTLLDKITDYCGKNSISTAPLEAINGRSEVHLPLSFAREVEASTWFDVGLMDGGHGWPTVFVDFCYLHGMLRKGGLLVVDDTQLYSVKELVRFLLEDPRLKLIGNLGRKKTLVFQKLHEGRFLPDWSALPYIKRMSVQDQEAGRAWVFERPEG